MSRGPRRVQRAITAAFAAEPTRRFTTRELAALAYPGEEINRSRTNAVIRAVPQIEPALTFCRVGAMDRFGWLHLWGRV
jgi:hypothetical protein